MDQLLPGKPVKIGESWKISDDTIALLLALEEITSNSVQMVLNEVTPEFARFELAGQVEGKLYGAGNQIGLKAKCRFDRRTGRIDWFAMRLKQSRDIGLVEDGLDCDRAGADQDHPPGDLGETERCRAGRSQLETDGRLDARAVSAKRRRMPVDARSLLVPDRTATRDYDEFHRLDRGQDIGLCKISPQPQVERGQAAHPRTIPGHRAEIAGREFRRVPGAFPGGDRRPTCEFCGSRRKARTTTFPCVGSITLFPTPRAGR